MLLFGWKVQDADAGEVRSVMGNDENKNLTIADVAEALGVSKTTVSRAISGKGRIGIATRDRVLKYIEEHDYKPNVIAKGLAQSKTYNLCVVMPADYAVVDLSFFRNVFLESRRLQGLWSMIFCCPSAKMMISHL